MVDRDPTPGELQIMLKNINEALRDLKNVVATKEFVNAKFDSYNDRVSRLESDVKDWIQTSTAAHVSLDAQSQQRQDQIRTEIDTKVGAVSLRIDQIEADQREQERALKAQRNGRAQAITIAVLGSILSVVGSVIASGVIRGLFPVS